MTSFDGVEHVADFLDEVYVNAISTPWEETGILEAVPCCPPIKELLLRVLLVAVGCPRIASGNPKRDGMAIFRWRKQFRGGRIHTLGLGALPNGLHQSCLRNGLHQSLPRRNRPWAKRLQLFHEFARPSA